MTTRQGAPTRPGPEVDQASPKVRLGEPIPAEAARTIERRLQLDHFKWDTQVGGTRVLLPQALVVARSDWDCLTRKAEAMARELGAVERAVAGDPALRRRIGVPRGLRNLLRAGTPACESRSLRFDFHPTAGGWVVSEVNADVPGGFGEGSALRELFAPFRGRASLPPCPLTRWGEAVRGEVPPGHAALLHAAGHLEDLQVVLALGRELQRRGFTPHLIQSPAALRWRDGEACLAGAEGVRLALVVRFFQAEWLARLPRRTGWRALLRAGGRTRVVNPVESALSESKRLPLVFGTVPAATDTLRELFAECRDPRAAGDWTREETVLKAAYANTGDAVFLGAETPAAIWKRRRWWAWWHPTGWVLQRRFQTLVLSSVGGPVRPCVGIFVVGGRAAGAYVRLARTSVTDGSALEAPLWVLPDEDWT